MAKDPAFLFYPGDYLRDTQCLSEPAQVAYDRIMCEHMRNICISKEQLDFFTKRLNDDQKREILMVLTVIDGGFQIAWVADSIQKRRKYSEGRRNNRKGKGKKISSSYVSHMENEIVNENAIVIGNKKEWSIILKTPYANQRPKLIYDLQLYFAQEGKATEFELADFTDYDGFMKANPANEFKDDTHLYNAFRKFHVNKQLLAVAAKNGSRKKLTLKDIDG